MEWITKSSYDASQKAVVFETGHFSIYGIGYKNPAPAFTDITGHWAADNILFVASRGLLSGTSDTTFSPNTGMTEECSSPPWGGWQASTRTATRPGNSPM